MRKLTPIIKPVGNACNSRCKYCFYTGRHPSETVIMSEDICHMIIRKFLSWDTDAVDFIWHGGEPLLAGIDFYKNAVKLQNQYRGKISITNGFQTNGTLLNNEWLQFCIDNNFDIGLSFDGLPELHNKYRLMPGEKKSYTLLYNAIDLMQQKQMKINVICVVTNEALDKANDIIKYCMDRGINTIEFSPCLDSNGIQNTNQIEISYDQFTQFMLEIYDAWVMLSEPSFRIRTIDNVIAGLFNKEPNLCHMRAGTSCGLFATIDNFGNLFICDNLDSNPEFRIGNISEVESHVQITESDHLIKFRRDFENFRSRLDCDHCEIQNICSAGCPRYAHLVTKDRCEALILFINEIKDRVQNVISENLNTSSTLT